VYSPCHANGASAFPQGHLVAFAGITAAARPPVPVRKFKPFLTPDRKTPIKGGSAMSVGKRLGLALTLCCLIAAAPEMLAALKWAMDYLKGWPADSLQRQCRDACQDAIRKATGGS
jgi:hypothetical protein